MKNWKYNLTLSCLTFCIVALGAAHGDFDKAPYNSGADQEADTTATVEDPVLGIEELCRLDLIPKMKRSVSVGSVSSYDRTGGNDDGFKGTYSFIRKEEGGLVIADLKGPGIIYRIHTPTPSDDIIEFYFDGESSPRISRKFSELFEGTHKPFLAPLVGSGAGGHYCYIPLTYQKSCKILVKAETFYFYQINYASYPENTVIPTYKEPLSATFNRHLAKAQETMRSTGTDIATRLVAAKTLVEAKSRRLTLRPGKAVTLFEMENPGRLVSLTLSPATAFAGKDKDVLIKMYWDGDTEPAVSCPVGDFFGYSFGEPAIRSLFLGTSGDTNYIYLPMPFKQSARIELVSERKAGPAIEIQTKARFTRLGKADDEGHFYALWRRENPTQKGSPFTFLKTTGQGHVIGVVLQAQGLKSGGTLFFEGDDRTYIGGELAISGTGSEDYFNGGWYDVPGRWETRVSFPLSGCLDYKKHMSRTGGYRWMITDAYPYTSSIDFNIEHAPEGNLELTDYTSVTFFYSLNRPSVDFTLPAVNDRRVSDPEKIIFTPGWNVPIRTFSLRNVTITKNRTTIGENRYRHMSLRVSGKGSFGRHHISFICDFPREGRYNVGLKALKGPDQGIVQLYQHDSPVGDPENLHAENQEVSPILHLGVQEMMEGNNDVFLMFFGKDANIESFGLDLVELIFERIE